MTSRIVVEILRVLSEAESPLSSKDIADSLKEKGINLEPRTIRYHLSKMDKAGLTQKPVKYKRIITPKGKEVLRRSLVFERLGEFSERVEYNVFMSNFSIDEFKGTIPTNIAILDKKHYEKAMTILNEVSQSRFIVSDLITVIDESERAGYLEIPKNKFAVGIVSNTIFDVILRKYGVVLTPEASGLLHVEKKVPQGFSELISYSGTTLSPGWLFVKSRLTSVFRAEKKGYGDVIATIRSFNVHLIDVVKRRVSEIEEKGIRGIISISYPLENHIIQSINFKANLIIYAGVNYLAPLQEKGLNPEIHINEQLIEISEFKKPEKYI
ncbi:Uncharacterized protein conserved in archaea [Archaeoglobus sulfaticallidus PM70-1]|uniref:Uncharacterized protein conserved in archaea n=1 Tax=Archaeoglobus sulfaticallidus PM70-1 TaxID=387631 RepID=N0BJI1_9EURY|nr:NrpR regulatory domain-containing protein [Archaeoglobus sulfaticallidus]AGK60310.1 Uncharacterized protein conserved in archaea [Archaeoglobus sulfaticallidus PM70-1]